MTDRTLVFTYGRFNPPTVGHQQVIQSMELAKQGIDGSHIIVGVSRTEDKKKNQDSQSQANGNGGGAPKGGAKPAGDSEVKGAKAPGEVTPKKLAKGGAWGNLDEKERKEAKQAVSRDFPPYYRQAIEEYFRKLAERE
jgi:hypothetical protein